MCESILVMGVDTEVWGDYPCGCVFKDRMGE